MLSINPDEKDRKENSGQPAYPCGSGAIRKGSLWFSGNQSCRNKLDRTTENLKASLIMQHKPELLGQRKDIPKPDFHNEESVKIFEWNGN